MTNQASLEAATLMQKIEGSEACLFANDAKCYATRVNEVYDGLANRASAEDLVQLRLMRSLWAKRSLLSLIEHASLHNSSLAEFSATLDLIRAIRGFIASRDVATLVDLQRRAGDRDSGHQLACLLADFADERVVRAELIALGAEENIKLRVGPEPIRKMRPIKKSGRTFDPNHWLSDPRQSAVEFVDGDPDRVRIRGIELRSGDLGIVQLNHPGDGIPECFLEQPGVAPHAMLYVTRRFRVKSENKTLYQPCLIEIYEGGWRSVPLTTGLSPNFSWYSEWVRPNGLPSDVGQLLSDQLSKLETVSFDFCARKIPAGGEFGGDWGLPSASCTNFIRIPFERAKLPSLPYPTTPVHPVALENLQRIGLSLCDQVHTPTNILNDSGYAKIGIIDNGFPEFAYAQALVVGRPDQSCSFGGMLSQRRLLGEKLPDWHNFSNWKSAWESLKISAGKQQNVLGSALRASFGYSFAEIPAVSPTVLSFYVRSDQEAGWIVSQTVAPKVCQWFEGGGSSRISEMRKSTPFTQLLTKALKNSAMEREGWYAPHEG